ncbi:hypothetical protein BCR39DRAFT_557681 [Naematelia encephala]|uniref:Uncharacterized protein n=1 Tax=Naematelia encephala TaxID=71784 RepID=A0A1Y2BC49_9TREE|nr:hypothetical protein BCR39DRAFT_557681 [Naematelia encephala]
MSTTTILGSDPRYTDLITRASSNDSEWNRGVCPSVAHWNCTDQQASRNLYPETPYPGRRKVVKLTFQSAPTEDSVQDATAENSASCYMHPSCAYDYTVLAISRRPSDHIDGPDLLRSLRADYALTTCIATHIAHLKDLLSIQFGYVVPVRGDSSLYLGSFGDKPWYFLPGPFPPMSLNHDKLYQVDDVRTFFSNHNEKPWDYPLNEDDIRASRLSRQQWTELPDPEASIYEGWGQLTIRTDGGTGD